MSGALQQPGPEPRAPHPAPSAPGVTPPPDGCSCTGCAEGQRRLREAEALLAGLPTILIGISAELRVRLWNLMAEKVFGRSAQATCGHPLDRIEIGWDWPRVRQGLDAAAQAASPCASKTSPFCDATGRKACSG